MRSKVLFFFLLFFIIIPATVCMCVGTVYFITCNDFFFFLFSEKISANSELGGGLWGLMRGKNGESRRCLHRTRPIAIEDSFPKGLSCGRGRGNLCSSELQLHLHDNFRSLVVPSYLH